MKKIALIFLAIVLIVVGLLASTIISPVLIIAEDTGEDASVDMAAKFSLLGGFEWVYPGSSFNANGDKTSGRLELYETSRMAHWVF